MRIKFLDNLPQDKLLHAQIGSIAYTVVLAFCVALNNPEAPIDAFIMTCLLGGLIEVLQKITGFGVAEYWDMIAVWLGAIVPFIAVLIVI